MKAFFGRLVLALAASVLIMLVACSTQSAIQAEGGQQLRTRGEKIMANQVQNDDDDDFARKMLRGGRDDAQASGWAVSGNLFTTDPTTKLQVQAIFNEPGTYTVEFDAQSVVASGLSGRSSRTEALISWTVAGSTVTRRVTVAHGVSVSGEAEAVRVVMSDVSLGAAPPVEYAASALVVKGLRASYQPAILLPRPSFDSTVVAAGSGFTFAGSGAGPHGGLIIPSDAGVVSVGVTIGTLDHSPIPDQDFQVIQLDAANHHVKQYDPRVAPFVPLHPDCTELQVFNNTATNVLVTVAFGIDG